jgi:hypothetical protein
MLGLTENEVRRELGRVVCIEEESRPRDNRTPHLYANEGTHLVSPTRPSEKHPKLGYANSGTKVLLQVQRRSNGAQAPSIFLLVRQVGDRPFGVGQHGQAEDLLSVLFGERAQTHLDRQGGGQQFADLARGCVATRGQMSGERTARG